MALKLNYLTSQTDFSREPRIRVYGYEKYPSRERRAEDRERYPSVYKIFNNQPSLGDTGVGAQYMNPTPAASLDHVISAHPKAHPEAVESVKYDNTQDWERYPNVYKIFNKRPSLGDTGDGAQYMNPTPVASQDHVISAHPKAYPEAVESVKYDNTRGVSQRPISYRPHPKAYPKTVESMQYGDTDWASQRPHSPPPHERIQTHAPHEKGKFVENKSQAPVPSQHPVVTYLKARPETSEVVKYDNTSRASQRALPPQPREKAKFVGHEEENGRNDRKQESDVGEEQCVDAAAAGFIEWKRRTLQMCKTFSD